MASSSNRDQLLQAFIASSKKRRKPKPPGLKRLETNYPNPAPYFVPGLSEAQQERERRKEDQYKARHDQTTRTSPGQRMPYTGPTSARARKLLRKRRTKPTPGSAYNRNRPTLN